MRRLFSVFLGLSFLAGFAMLVYPTVSDQWNTYRQSRLISEYETIVREQMTEEDFSSAWAAARSYNDSFAGNNIYNDVFDDVGTAGEQTVNSQILLADTEYGQLLNVAGDGVMGYISIPKINIRLAIYHGTAEDILQTGVGHLSGSKLPVGGEGMHSVLAAHRGLPSARLFTDIDQLGQGDVFYITILNETLAYQVDAVAPMVDKDDFDTLEKLLQVEEGQDLVTLFTCTPYGVNSHRLLVRGHRIPYEGELEKAATPVNTMLQAVRNYYMLYMLLGLAVTGLAILILKYIFRPKRQPEDT